MALRTNQNTFLAANTFSGVVIATNVANQFAGAFLGTFFGNGAGLTNLPNFAATNAWNLAGNAGTSPTINFLGTTDGQPLILKAAGGVGIGTTNPSAPLTVIGARAGSYTTPVVYIENTNVAGNSSPALRLASSGNTADGVLNVSAFGTGKIAAFGANPFGEVVNLDTNGSFFFDPRTRQMLNLWGTLYGIGVQNFTLYARSDGGFAWFNKGTHANSQNDAGAGGTTLMSLSSSGDLSVLGAINVGSYSGNGAGLSGLWKTSGNAGTTSADFIGTTDNQALQLKVNGARAFRLEPNANSPNVIGGFAGNRVPLRCRNSPKFQSVTFPQTKGGGLLPAGKALQSLGRFGLSPHDRFLNHHPSFVRAG